MLDVSSLLSDFSVATESDASPSEANSFFATLAHNAELQACLFDCLLSDDHANIKPEIVSSILDLLMKWYRHITIVPAVPGSAKTTSNSSSTPTTQSQQAPYLVLQYLPNLMALSWALRGTTDKELCNKLDTFLLTIYNSTVVDQNGQGKEQVVRIPPLNHSSIYHESARLLGEVGPGIGSPEQGPGHQVSLRLYKQVLSITAGNRSRVYEGLFRTYNEVIGELPKFSLEQFMRTSQKLLQRRSPNNKGVKGAKPKVVMSNTILQELVFGAYFCIYNGFQLAGSQVVDLIRDRGAAQTSPAVLLTTNAIKTVVLNSGPSQLPSTSITTPSQIAKNMITNASFRAKKMGDDIPKVSVESSPQPIGPSEENPMERKLKALADMPAITEEVVEEIIERGTPSKGSGREKDKDKEKEDGNIGGKQYKEKLKAKLNHLNIRKKPSSGQDSTDADQGVSKSADSSSKSKGERKMLASVNAAQVLMEMEKDQAMTNAPMSAGVVSSSEAIKLSTLTATRSTGGLMKEKPSHKISLESASGKGQESQPQSAKKHSDISMEEVEAMMQQNTLPPQTITIHSPGSGTTII